MLLVLFPKKATGSRTTKRQAQGGYVKTACVLSSTLSLLPSHFGFKGQDMPEDQQQAAAVAPSQSKSKHGHAASQAPPAPRKVRFNVGEC